MLIFVTFLVIILPPAVGAERIPYSIPKDLLDPDGILTTANDDYYILDALETIPGSIGRLEKRAISSGGSNKKPTVRVVEIDFGANITRLLSHLRNNRFYDSRIRPNYNGRPVDVGVTLFVSTISQISEANMDITLDFYFRQIWQDSRLDFKGLWNEEIVMGGEYVREIWRPDTFFVNAKYSVFHHVTALNTFIRIAPNGNLIQSLRLTVTAHCPMDFTYFPMDTQMCALEIESYGYTMKDIAYRWARDQASVKFGDEVHLLPQFRIKGHREFRKEIGLSTGNYSRLVVNLYFERSLGYYLIQIYLPSTLIVASSLVSFWISRESAPARVSLGITTVLTMTTLMSSTNQALPKISYLKAVDVYLSSCFVCVFAALLEYAAVTYTGKRCKMVDAKKQARRAKMGSDYESEDDDGETACCDMCRRFNAKASDIERLSRIIFPSAFTCFNVGYWITYLNISVANTAEGFIPVSTE